MAPALVQHRHHRLRTAPSAAERAVRARDWAEIQERMLVPLYEAVYERLETGPGSQVLGLGCGSGLALLLAAERGAAVHGVDSDEARLGLARERLLPGPEPERDARSWDTRPWDARPWDAQLSRGGPAPDGPDEPVPARALPPHAAAPTLVTAFEALPGARALARAVAGLRRGTPVVLAGWGPPERCATASALRVAARLAEPASEPASEPGPGPGPGAVAGPWCGRDDLEDLAVRAGLRPDGSGRVACPFGYAGMDSAVRGLLSTGLFDPAVRATDEEQVLKELAEALHPYLRGDGTVWMPNLFRYVIART